MFERARQKGAKVKQLDNDNLDCPKSHLWWSWFLELNTGRQAGMALNPLSWSDIKAWCELTNNALTEFDISVIRRLDNEFIIANQQKKD